jgi:hypothetical protein
MQAILILGIAGVGVGFGYVLAFPAALALAGLLAVGGVVFLVGSRGTGMEGLLYIIIGIPMLVTAVVVLLTTLVVNNVMAGLDLSWLVRV